MSGLEILQTIGALVAILTFLGMAIWTEVHMAEHRREQR